MKNLFFLLSAILLFSYASSSAFAESDQQSAKSEICLATVNGYMGALKSGNLEQLIKFIAPPLLHKKKKLLGNQSYSNLLYKKFNTSTHNATISNGGNKNTIFVDVVISFIDQEPMKTQFQTKPYVSPLTQEISCKIVAETA